MYEKRIHSSLAVAAVLFATACQPSHPGAPTQSTGDTTSANTTGGAGDVNGLLGAESDGSNWLAYGRTFSADHYSPLDQINDQNVARLGLAWYYDLPPMASVFGAPLAVDGTLYFAVGYSIVHAMDAQSGKLLWRYDPQAPQASGQKLRGGWGVRGIAYWDGKVYTGTHDGRLIALDAKSGALLWSAQTTEADDGRYITGPPWVFNGKVMIGHGGSDFAAVRGYVSAYDARTGELKWRFYTVPGDPAKGFENDTMKMAAQTWSGEWWRFGGAGGTAWHAMTYDPKFNRVYIGTSNGMPWNPQIRSQGDNLFLSSIVALDADTGAYVWHYQLDPGEAWDYDACMDIELADLDIGRARHSVILHAAKDGFFYVIDRENGKLLSAEKYTKATWADRIDLESGRPVESDIARYWDGKPALIYPGPVGGHSIEAMSFNPKTGLAYIPATELAGVYANPAGDPAAWQPAGGMVVNTAIGRAEPPIERPPGSSSLLAWNPVTQSAAWSVPLVGIINGGTATTAGNLVFQGQVTGELDAYAGDSGKKLWSFDAQTGIQAQPVTYVAGGRQYVTVIAGWRGMGSSSGAKPDWEYRLQPRRVLTFVLDGNATLPPPGPRSTDFVDDPAFVVDPDKAAIGAAVVGQHCLLCHGVGLASGGSAPDLRKSPVPLSLEGLTSVLHDGSRVAAGMPAFPEFTPEQIEGIQHFIRKTERDAAAAAATAAN